MSSNQASVDDGRQARPRSRPPRRARLAGARRRGPRVALRQQLRSRASRRPGRFGRGARRAGACFSPIAPRPRERAAPVAHSPEVARALDLSEADCASEAFVQVMAGNALLRAWRRTPPVTADTSSAPGPASSATAGHLAGRGPERGGERWELQLKGAAPRPTRARPTAGRPSLVASRVPLQRGDGASRRADHARAEPGLERREVVRDMFYDGHPRAEPGAIVCRVAPSFLRFGNFELFAARGEIELLTRLADYTLRHHFPELGAPSSETYAPC